jgi:hypothetical protein
MTWMMYVLVGVGAAGSGFVTAGVLTRRRFARMDGAFQCRVRSQYERLGADGPRWCRRTVYAIWAHDVLLVQYGLVRPRLVASSVHLHQAGLRTVSGLEVRGLGYAPVVLRLEGDSGCWMDVAGRANQRTLLVGPFLTAALPGLPEAPTERRPRPRT